MDLKDLTDHLSRRKFLAEVVALGGFSFGGAAPSSATTTDDKAFKWRGEISRADIINSNKRIYPREVLEKAVVDFHKLPPRTLMGELGMSGDSIIHLSRASHIVTDMELTGDSVIAECEVLNTPNGYILKRMIAEGKVAFRTAGVGSGRVDENGVYVIGPDFKLITVNAVSVDEAARF